MDRFRFSLIAAAAAAAYMVTVQAQHPLIGTYNGSMRVSETYHVYFGLQLVIEDVSRFGGVKGNATVYQGPCAGVYAMQGRYQGNELRIRALEGPCTPFGFAVTHEGNQLSGTNALGFPINLTK